MKRKYAYLMLSANPSVSFNRSVWSKIQGIVDPSDIADDGIEDMPHITLLANIVDSPENINIVKNFAGNIKPIEVTLNKLGLFENDVDVLKFDILSDELFEVNEKIADLLAWDDLYGIYRPHMTVAYLKKGLGKKYLGKEILSDSLLMTTLLYSDANRNITEIPIGSTGMYGLPLFENFSR